jgi:hypothetical protein
MLIPAVGQTAVPQVILDVKASGFKIEPEGEHTYLRVYDNGDVIFDDYKSSINGFYLYQSNLPSKRLAGFKTECKEHLYSGSESSYSFASPLKAIVTKVEYTLSQRMDFKL